MAEILKPGQRVEKSGQYEVIGAHGEKSGREVTLVKGDKAPPMRNPGEQMVLVDETKHKDK